jgi:hypothetical protein
MPNRHKGVESLKLRAGEKRLRVEARKAPERRSSAAGARQRIEAQAEVNNEDGRTSIFRRETAVNLHGTKREYAGDSEATVEASAAAAAPGHTRSHHSAGGTGRRNGVLGEKN